MVIEIGNKSIICLSAVIAVLAILVSVSVLGGVSAADAGDQAADGSISWIFTASALVLLMVPGVAFFYGGMLRKQSMTATIAQCIAGSAVVAIVWFAVGYSVAFGCEGVIGDFSKIFLLNVDWTTDGSGISELQFAIYQMMFASVTACVILGASAERIRFPAVCLFLALWAVFVYAPMAHWVWNGGFEAIFGDGFRALDFAGGTVVHICAGISGVALATFLGPRKDHVRHARPHNVPLMFLGAGLLLVGWFGFNGGSGGAADGVAVIAVATTAIAWVASTATWAVIQYTRTGKVTVTGLCAGMISGLVAITPCAGYVLPAAAFVIGIGGAVVCYISVSLLHSRKKLDDALDVFAVHGCGGIFGAVALGFAADPALVNAGYEGLLYGGTGLIVGQIVAVAVTLVFCFAVSYALIWIVSKFVRVGVDPAEAEMGQDIVEHGEPSYLL